MINVRRNVKRKYQQAFDQSREVITEINLFWCSEGYIVWLLGCAVSRSPPSGHILSASSVFPPVVAPGPAHCELVISPVTLSFVLPRLALTVVRGSTWIWEILSSTCRYYKHRGDTIWIWIWYYGEERRMRNSCVSPDRQSDASGGLCRGWSENYNLWCSLGLKDLEM